MNCITVDTELMTQYVPAQGISETSHLIALRDEHDQIMILTLGYLWKDENIKLSRFYLLKKDISGMYEKHDLGTMLGLPSSYKAAAMQAVQDPTSGLIYLAFSVENDLTHGRVLLLEPLSPQDLVSSSLQKYIIPRDPSSNDDLGALVVGIFLGTPSKDKYPLVVVTYKPLNQLGTEDVKALAVAHGANSKWTWKVDKRFLLSSSTTGILALQPFIIDWMSEEDEDISVPTPAVCFLYKQNEETRLSLMVINSHHDTFHPSCPPGSTTLACVPVDNGYSDLLVGGSDLYYFSHVQIKKKNARAQRVLNDDSTKFDCTNQLFVAHSPNSKGISVWGESANKGISYLIPDSFTNNTKKPVPLIPDQKGGSFSAFKAANSQMEQFVYHSGEREMAVLEMDPSNGFWKSVPLMIQTVDQKVEFQAHVTHVFVKDHNNRPLPNYQLELESQNLASVLVNGIAVVSAPTPHRPLVRTDSRGCLSITTPTGSLFSDDFQLIDPKTSTSLLIDPNIKVKEALRRVSKPENLEKDKVLLKNLNKDFRDHKCIETIADIIEKMMRVIDRKPLAPTEFYAGTIPLGHPDMYSIIDRAKDLLHEFLHWVDETYHEAKSWIIRTVKGGYEFFIELGEKVYRWVVTTVEEAWNGIKLVINKIFKIGKDILQWIGYIFEWDDILATHKSIVHLAQSAFKVAPDYIATLKRNSDTFMNTLATHLKHWGDIEIPDAAANSAPDTIPSGSNHSDALNSSKFHHGGGAKGLQIIGEDSGGSDKLKSFWETLIVKAAQAGEGIIEDLCKAFMALFKTGSWGKVADVLRHLTADIMVKIVDIIKSLVDGFLDVLEAILVEFSSLMNKKISIPVISQLYEWKVGSPLTVLDGLALLVAFPTTVLHKSIYGKTPTDATQIDYKTLVSGQPLSSKVYPLNCLMGVSHLFSQIFMQITEAIGVTLGGGYYILIQEPSTTTSVEPFGLWDEYGRRIKNVFSVIGIVAGVPFVTLPHMDLRWSSWSLAAAKACTSILLRYIQSNTKEKVAAVIEGLLGSASYGLIIAVKVMEYKEAEDTPAKTWTTFDVIAATATEAGMIAADVGRFLPDPESRGIAETVGLVLDGASFGVLLAKFYIHASTQRYNEVLNI